MKRILALVLACVIAASMGAVAWASSGGFDPDNYDYEPGDGSTGYTTEEGWGGTEVASTIGMVLTATCDIVPTYYVTVTWENMAFTYDGDGAGVWSPETHTYGDGDGAWTNEDGNAESTITITNDSNVAVSVSCQYAFEPAYEDCGVTVELDKESTSLAAATPDDVFMSIFDTVTVSVSGAPKDSIAGVVGTITITIDSA